MKTILINFIKNKIDLSEKEIEILFSKFQIITKQKNDFLVNEGSKSSNLYFVINGFVRCFDIHNGNEITTQICTTNDFVTSFESFLNNVASKNNIQCSTDCTLLKISKHEHELLYREIFNWPIFCKSVYEDYIIKISERANSLQNLTASERYLKLLNTQPNIIQNTSIKHLASFLGIKPQSLSRIRKEIIK